MPYNIQVPITQAKITKAKDAYPVIENETLDFKGAI